MSEKIELLGVRLEVFETEEALEKIKEFLEYLEKSGKNLVLIAETAEEKEQHDRDFEKILKQYGVLKENESIKGMENIE